MFQCPAMLSKLSCHRLLDQIATYIRIIVNWIEQAVLFLALRNSKFAGALTHDFISHAEIWTIGRMIFSPTSQFTSWLEPSLLTERLEKERREFFKAIFTLPCGGILTISLRLNSGIVAMMMWRSSDIVAVRPLKLFHILVNYTRLETCLFFR